MKLVRDRLDRMAIEQTPREAVEAFCEGQGYGHGEGELESLRSELRRATEVLASLVNVLVDSGKLSAKEVAVLLPGFRVVK